MTHLIVLAAGSARRFGEDKLMWLLDGKPLLAHTLEKLTVLCEKHGWQLSVVTKEGPVARMAADFDINIVINPDHEQGISSSIKHGLSVLPKDACSAVFFVGDQPWLDVKEIEAFILGYIESGKSCGCVVSNGETGNPCAFSRSLFTELMTLEGDKGGKKVIMKHIDDCFFHEISDSRQLTDIDTKPDK